MGRASQPNRQRAIPNSPQLLATSPYPIRSHEWPTFHKKLQRIASNEEVDAPRITAAKGVVDEQRRCVDAVYIVSKDLGQLLVRHQKSPFAGRYVDPKDSVVRRGQTVCSPIPRTWLP